METLLIVLLLLFLIGVGGWGYSRWRGWGQRSEPVLCANSEPGPALTI
jgi:hypothetical protein